MLFCATTSNEGEWEHRKKAWKNGELWGICSSDDHLGSDLDLIGFVLIWKRLRGEGRTAVGIQGALRKYGSFEVEVDF
jgi:hypothetical protein